MHRVAEHPAELEEHTINTCYHNEYDGLINRHLVEQPAADEDFFSWARAEIRKMVKVTPHVERVSLEELYRTRSSHVKKRWRRILHDDAPCDAKDAFVKSFVKFEKYEEAGKVPRIIQSRGVKYTAHLATFLAPLEHAVYSTRYSNNDNIRGFAKGRNARQRAYDLLNLVYAKLSRFFEIDHSKFDSLISVKHLKLIHYFYLKMFSGHKDKWYLKKLLAMQLKNIGITRGGIFYKCKGRRMSGDFDTGLGNSILNYLILKYVFRMVRNRIYVDGDDSVVAIDNRDLTKEDVLAMLAKTGMRSTVTVKDDIEDVEFCQSKILDTVCGPILARNPFRAISRMCWALKSQIDKIAYLSTNAFGEMHSSSGVPIIFDFAKKHFLGEYNVDQLEYKHKLNMHIKPVAPHDLSRLKQFEQWDHKGVFMYTLI